MTTLTVWTFDTPTGAKNAVDTLQRLDKQGLIQIHDAATVSWPADKKKPKTEQLRGLARPGALRGVFWGLLFGLLFSVPLLGVAIGAGIGGATGVLADVGIDEGFINQVRDRLTPGTSALFVYSSDAVLDQVVADFKATGAHLIKTDLSPEEDAKLRDAFGEDD